MAPIRDVSDTDSVSVLPGSARLLDALELEPPDRRRDRGPLAQQRKVHVRGRRRVV